MTNKLIECHSQNKKSTKSTIKEKINIKNLYIDNIPVAFLKKEFVQGLNTNYEKYLCEFINSESKFINDYGEKKFGLTNMTPEEQKKGDLTNDNYDIELKLLVDSRTVQDKEFYESGYIKAAEGVVIGIDSKYNTKFRNNNNNPPRKQYTIRFLIKFFRNLCLEDYIRIEKTDKGNLEKDERLIKDFIKNININKNVLYHNPFPIYFKGVGTSKRTIEFIIKRFNMDFKGFIEYRKKQTDKDTYLSFITTDYIVFLKEINGRFKYYDKVLLSKSRLYTEISDLKIF